MYKLIAADLPRVLRSKILYVLLLLTAFMAVASVTTVLLTLEEKSLLFAVSSNNLAMFFSIMLPVFSGGLSVMLIAAEFSSGVIRNKCIMGHKRRDILLAWGVIYTGFTVLVYLLYIGIYFLTLLAVGADFTGADAGVIAGNLLMLLLFSVKFQMFSFLLVCIYPDSKTAVIGYLLNNLTIVPLMLLSLSDENSKVIAFLSRIFIFGYAADEFSLMTKPDQPWFSALCILVLSAVYLLLAKICFERKDLK